MIKSVVLITAFTTIFFINAAGQNAVSQKKDTLDDEAFVAVEHGAEFPGGMANFYKFIAVNVQYPEHAFKDSIQGKIYLSFIVEKDGQLTNVKVLKGLSPDLDEEAIRLLEISPKWNPGEQNNLPVRQKLSLPISFILKDTISLKQESADSSDIYSKVDQIAEFPGGVSALYNFLGKRLNYPELARARGIQGKVFVQFVVEKDGSLSNIKIMRSIGYGFAEEVVRVLKLSPKWNPAKKNGAPVRTLFTMPVNFTEATSFHKY